MSQSLVDCLAQLNFAVQMGRLLLTEIKNTKQFVFLFILLFCHFNAREQQTSI
jgi:hypothetical protein